MKTAPFRCAPILPALIACLVPLLTKQPSALAATADLWQARNGNVDGPVSPVEWVKGNASPANSHYMEGHSISYRMVMTDLTPGLHTLIIEWDTRHKAKHAIDYLTHYDRLAPHDQFASHVTTEVINPLIGVEAAFGTPRGFAIPAPSSLGSPVAGQPGISFQSLPQAARVLTIWNGTITNVTYVTQEPLTGESAVSRLAVEFLADDPTVVLAWGGHIGSKLDWGSGNSASSIGGSPYHMRKIDLDGAGGNQDRSVQALAISGRPTSVVTGPAIVCAAVTNTFIATTDSTDPATAYQWSLANNTAGAILVGSTNSPRVQVRANSAGNYSLQALVVVAGIKGVGSVDVSVTPSTTVSPLENQTVCPGSGVTFRVTAAGTAPLAIIWTRNGHVIAGATNSSLVLPSVVATDSGRYCAEVIGACGSASTCASLTVESAPVLFGPANATRECLADVPPPDPGSVRVTGGAGAVTVVHTGDAIQTNDCVILVTRTYQATDSCGSQASSQQIITVRDTQAPTFAALPNRSVECGLDWSFEAPSVNDECDRSSVALGIVGTVTNHLQGQTFAATRTWRATDRCGNSATISQTVTVVDTTAPEIACATNTVAHCTGAEGAIVSFPVSVTDVCDASVVVHCAPPSGSVFPLGNTSVQCASTDVSGNLARCSFSVTIIDVEPPRINCPANVFVVEEAPGSGQAVAFSTPSASDNVDLNPAIVCSPPSGSVFPVGERVVLCIATDASGNTNTCSFQVRIVPRVIVANSTADSGPGTLRQALLDANAAPGSNVIAFAFPGGAPYTIHLLSPLPVIVDALTIDGWSQLEFAGQPVIELNGSNVVAATSLVAGLSLNAGDTEVRGLVLTGFEVGIRLAGSGGNVIRGNFIGVNSNGPAARGNTGDGIQIHSANNRVGGEDATSRNIISGNHGHGLVLDGSNAMNNIVLGNSIGTDSESSRAWGNGGNGVVLRNGAANNRIGPDNVIAFNHLNGLLLETTAGNGNAIRGNAIFSNGALGIDLGGDGMTPNDPSDDGTGPNHFQNFPVLIDARLTDGTTIVVGMLNSTANGTFQIDFFLNSTVSAGNDGEGKRFLGSATVGTDETGRGDFSITLPLAVPADQFITATVTDAGNNTSEFSLAVKVGSPPVIILSPMGATVAAGAAVTFCVTAEGSQPLTYHWRLNGANIPDATNECFFVQSAQLTNGGSYTVVVANDLGVVTSDPAVLRLILPSVPAGDNFVDRVRLTQVEGLIAWNNTAATREPGEPNHAAKPGGKSIWYTWTAPATGVATFSAIGSAFDTLLAVYVGGTVTNLTLVGSDEDRGGFFTSVVRFNAMAGTQYQIAIDGFGAVSGECVFSWLFEPTNRLLPVIFASPTSQTVAAGSSATFKVDASVDCREPHYNCRRVSKDQPQDNPGERDPLTYQWYFNSTPIAGATRSSLTVTNVQSGNVGSYTVQVSGDGRMVETVPVSLQINDSNSGVQNVQATDKFLDAANSAPLRLGTPLASIAAAEGSNEPVFVPAVIVRSYTSTQVFSSLGGSTSAGELLPCYGVGGASEWFAVVAEESGVLHVNTDGSSYDTVLAVYTHSPGNAGLNILGCDNNSGLDRRDSALAVPVVAGRTNFVVIDGYNGAYGVAALHFSLVTQGALTPLGLTAQKAARLRVTGQPSMRFMLQTSSNLVTWTSILTNSSTSGLFDYVDTRSTNAPRRFYRAVMLP